MKTIETIAGNVYVITSKNGGTVTDATGTLSETIEAGKQLHVTAPSDMLLIDDEEAIMRPANFKHARLALRMLEAGKKAELPAGYTRLDFLESDGAATMELPFESKNKSFVCEHTLGMPKTTSGLYVYGGMAVSVGYGIRYYANLQGLSFTGSDRIGNGTFLRGGKYKLQWEVARNEEGKFIFSLAHKGETLAQRQQDFNQYWLNVYNVFSTTEYGAKLGGATYELTINIEGASVKYVPAIDRNGRPCLYGIEPRTPYYNSGSGAFIAGVDTVAQLATLLKRLPATGGALTLSLPAEANTPEVADMLQQCHDTKGWTLTVYEYRPAAAVTYSLRRVREVVWCRKQNAEYGNYLDDDGKHWHIERCAAIYGPLGQDPAAYGYEPFDSVEDAAAWFGLTPYEYPEDETF